MQSNKAEAERCGLPSRQMTYSDPSLPPRPQRPQPASRAFSFVPESALAMGFGRMPRPVPASRVSSIGSQKGGMPFFCRNLFWLASCLGGLTNGMMHGHVAAIIDDDFFKSEMPMSSTTLGFMVSMMQVGALVGSVALGSQLSDKHGRKFGMAVSMLLFLFGGLATASLRSVAGLFVGRFTSGLGMGLSCQTIPIYLSELSPMEYRGMLDTSFQLFVNLGVMTGYLLNLVLLPPAQWWGWRLSFFSPALPATLLLIVCCTFPESPRWLVMKGRVSDASEVLRPLRASKQEVDFELQDILLSLRSDSREGSKFESPVGRDGVPDHTELMQDGDRLMVEDDSIGLVFAPRFRRPFLIGVAVLVFQVLTGIDIMTIYSPKLLKDAGYSLSLRNTAAIAIGVTFPAASVVGVALVDRVGRRVLLMLGSCGMGLATAVLALMLYPTNTSWWILPAAGSESSGVLAVAAILSWVFFFSISWGPLPWCLAPELFPLRIRGRAMSLGVFSNWVADWVVVLSFVPLADQLGNSGVVLCYVPICVLAGFLVFFYVPETLGVSLEAVEALLFPSIHVKDLQLPLLSNDKSGEKFVRTGSSVDFDSTRN
eukprot:gb/GEZN01003328.1/.p1 GENE.gb/GEZN01003328.1/~~gb/GEZN01003328.1/.p1  ORF type:complete len:597 (+),score=74.99 gb/GEZN01003328.1/:33-1823(+)